MKRIHLILCALLAALGLTFQHAAAENWATIVTTDNYAQMLSRLQGRDTDLARMFATDQTASSNAPANTIQINWANKTFERCTGVNLTSCSSIGTLGHSITGSAPWSGITGKPTTRSGYGITDAAPLDTTLADNAGSTTLPATSSGSLVSKTQSLRDNVKELLSYFSAGKANSAATADAAPWSGITSKPTTRSGYGITDAAPLDTTLADNAGSTTLPATSSGSLVSKIQSLRDNVKELLSYFSAGKANSAAAADTAAELSGTHTIACSGDVSCPATSYAGTGAKTLTATLANSGVTAGSYGEPGSARTLSFGGSFTVPELAIDAKGRATSAREVTLTLPAAPTSVSTATTATNISGGSAGNVLYQSGSGATAKLANPSGTSFLRSTGSTPSWRSAANVRSDIGAQAAHSNLNKVSNGTLSSNSALYVNSGGNVASTPISTSSLGFPGGMKIIAGRFNSTTDDEQTVTYPSSQTFSTACLSVVLTGGTNAHTQRPFRVKDTCGLSSFVVLRHSDQDGTAVVNFIAVGY